MASYLIGACINAAPMPLDPRIAMDELASHYRGASLAERIDVRVVSDGESRGESLTLQLLPPSTLQLTFGSFVLWTDGAVMRIIHRDDERAMYERQVDKGEVLGTIGSVLPPFPLPQLALALSRDPSAELTPYTKGIRWTSAGIDPQADPPVISIAGEGERVQASLTADASGGRILRMSTVIDGGRTRIDMTSEPLVASEAPPIGIEAGRRRLVQELSELKPRPGFILAGDALPRLGLKVWRDGVEQPDEPTGPGAVILMRRWSPGRSPWTVYEAARRVAGEIAGFRAVPVIVLPPGQPEPRAFIDGAAFEAQGLELRHSYSPESTIERFSETADQVLVILDRAGVVRQVLQLDPASTGAVFDESEVERLAAEMRRASGG